MDLILKIILVSALLANNVYAANPIKIFRSANQQVQLDLIKSGLGVVWGFDFINNEKLIFTERNGKMKTLHLEKKVIHEIKGLPKIDSVGQGGLLDIALHPEFSKNSWVFMSFTQKYDAGVGTIIAKAQLQNNKLINYKELFRTNPPGSGGQHFGSRIVFGKDNTIFFGVGDRGNRPRVQKLKYPNGKLFRIKQDGSIPEDNPFLGNKDAIKSIWSLGHRNPQGMAIHPETGELWEQEHGPKGGDEINLIKKGLNYGWPIITYGKEYGGSTIGPKSKPGLEQPIKHFTPSIAPSSLMIYSGKLFKKWKGNFFSASLKLKHLNRIVIKSKKVTREERLLKDLNERLRNVREAPGGEIYFSTDHGNIYKLSLVKH